MKKAERLIYYYDMSIEATSRTFEVPKSISIRKAFDLMELVPIAERSREWSKGREFLYVSDWNRIGNIICILINKSDKTLADPVFTIPKENSRRTAEKEAEEGQDFSAHLVVQLPDDDLDPALVLIEYCSGLGIFTIQNLLKHVLDEAKKIQPDEFVQIHPDGAVDKKNVPKKYNVTFHPDFKGHVSDDLKYDLDNGKIQSIELITEKQKFTNFDEDGYIVEKCKTLVLNLKDEENPITDKFNRIIAVCKQQKEDYSKARIKFKTPNGVDRTVEMDTAAGLADTYVKREKLDDFEMDLLASYEKFFSPIIEKMKNLLPQ